MSTKIREIMTSDVESCRPDSTIGEIAQIMERRDVGFVPVCEGERLVGLVTDRDIVIRCIGADNRLTNTHARDCMTTNCIVCSPDTDAHEAATMMADHQIRRLPVCEGDRLRGIVSLGDLATVQIHVNEAGEALSQISEPSHPQH